MFALYLITDPDAPGGVVAVTSAALGAAEPGRVAVQLRAKGARRGERARLGRALREVTRSAGAQLLVNGDLELALAIDADGAQLPEAGPPIAEARRRLGDAAILGASCHDRAGLARAAAEGATFATLSPFAEVPGKAPPLGARRFADLARDAALPVVALGGIDAGNAGLAMAAGASAVAVVRAVYRAARPEEAVRALLSSLAGAGLR